MEPLSGKSPIQWLESVDSTNLEVRRRIDELDNLSVIAARFQTAGRGQGSHTWLSPVGENLTFTLLLRFGDGGISGLKASEAVRITQMATLSVFDFLADEGITARIKWPNDIWVGDKKICGMLIENILDGANVSASIIGIGFNLNQKAFDPALPNPVSLHQLTGKLYTTDSALLELYSIICRQAALLDTPDGRYELEKRFNEHLFHLDRSRQEQLSGAIEDFEARR